MPERLRRTSALVRAGTYQIGRSYAAAQHRRESSPTQEDSKKTTSGDGLYKAVLEPKFDLTLARMASERSLRTFVVWPPVVHLQRDDDDTPTDGYGGNSSRFIEAYLGMDER